MVDLSRESPAAPPPPPARESPRTEDTPGYRDTVKAMACAIRCMPSLVFQSGGGYPARAGGPWLCRTLVLSLFHAVVVPSGLTTRVQPHRWITT